MGIAIPELPTLARQVMDYSDSLARHGKHPASVPQAQQKRRVVRARRKARQPMVVHEIPIRQQILAAARRLKPLWSVQDLIGELPNVKIASVYTELSNLVRAGRIDCVKTARYRLSCRPE